MGCCCGARGGAITAAVGVAVCAILAGTMPLLVNKIIDSSLSLKEGSYAWNMWEHAPIPMYINFYLFNITNSEDVTRHNVKPILEEVGPFVYQEVHERVNVTTYPNSTLEFKQRRSWYFIEERSTGSMSDMITTLNVPYLGAAYALRFQNQFMKLGFSTTTRFMGINSLFVTKNVSQLLFEGYDDPLLNIPMPPGLNITIPPFDKFGWFYMRNNSADFDGVYSIFTGVDDIANLGKIDMWNKMRNTGFYESYCGMVNGSYGEGWPPYRQKDSISMYSSDLCRTINLDFTETINHGGVEFYRFAGTKNTFAGKEENPDNWCFCAEGGFCPPASGVANSSVCRYGSPAFVSFPHYYAADEYYLNQVEGLKPDKEKHEFHIDLNPRMSVPLDVRARFQINLLIENVPGIRLMGNEARYVPVLWFGVDADLSDSLLGTIRLGLLSPMLTTVTFSVFAAINLVLAIVFIVKMRR